MPPAVLYLFCKHQRELKEYEVPFHSLHKFKKAAYKLILQRKPFKNAKYFLFLKLAYYSLKQTSPLPRGLQHWDTRCRDIFTHWNTWQKHTPSLSYMERACPVMQTRQTQLAETTATSLTAPLATQQCQQEKNLFKNIWFWQSKASTAFWYLTFFQLVHSVE